MGRPRRPDLEPAAASRPPTLGLQVGWTALPKLAWAWALAPALAWGAATASGAAEAVRVSLAPATVVPFTSDELASAIAMRLERAPLAGPVLVSIAPAAGDEGRIRIDVGDQRREVGVGEREAHEAARVVALLVLDLLDAAPAAAEARAEAPAPAAERTNAPAPAALAGGPTWRGSLAPLATPASSWDGTRFELDVDVERRLTARWRLGAALGYGRATRRAFGAWGAFQTVPVRAGVAFAGTWGDLRAQAAARAYWGPGASGALFGGWAEARPQLVRSSLGTLSAVLAVELLGERLQFHTATEGNVLAIDYVTPWLGLAWSSP